MSRYGIREVAFGVSVETHPPIEGAHGHALPGWEIRFPKPMAQLTFWKKAEAGQTSGHHFHKGNDDAKNPEVLLIIGCRVLVFLTDSDGMTEQVSIDATEGPVTVTFPPLISHAVRTLTPGGFFIECRSTLFDRANPDTYPMTSL